MSIINEIIPLIIWFFTIVILFSFASIDFNRKRITGLPQYKNIPPAPEKKSKYSIKELSIKDIQNIRKCLRTVAMQTKYNSKILHDIRDIENKLYNIVSDRLDITQDQKRNPQKITQRLNGLTKDCKPKPPKARRT